MSFFNIIVGLPPGICVIFQKIAVFRVSIREPRSDEDYKKYKGRVELAYKSAYKLFANIPGGAHSVSLSVINKLFMRMGFMKDETFWDIGCGVPVLAACASALTGVTSLGTDIGKYNVLLDNQIPL